MDRLPTERRPGVWHSRGLESDGVGGRDINGDGRGGWAEVHGRVEEKEVDAARLRQEKREANETINR